MTLSVGLLQVLRAGGHYVLVSCRDPDVRLPLVQRCGFRMHHVGHLARVCLASLSGVACCLRACLTWHAELTCVYKKYPQLGGVQHGHDAYAFGCGPLVL